MSYQLIFDTRTHGIWLDAAIVVGVAIFVMVAICVVAKLRSGGGRIVRVIAGVTVLSAVALCSALLFGRLRDARLVDECAEMNGVVESIDFDGRQEHVQISGLRFAYSQYHFNGGYNRSNSGDLEVGDRVSMCHDDARILLLRIASE